MRELVRVSEEVQTALDEERAVVALETTLIAHGFPVAGRRRDRPRE